MITTNSHRDQFESARFSVIMWQRRVEAAHTVSTSTRQSLVRAELKLAAMLEDAHTDALEVNASMHTTNTAAMREEGAAWANPAEHTTSPKVSLFKSYVPTQPVIVGRCDRPVYSPSNRTPRSHVNAEADLKLHNDPQTFSYILSTI